MNYVKRFLSFRCAGDVLNVVNPVQEIEKEITEAMAMVMRIRKIVLKYDFHYSLVDICAGNALSSVLAAHLFKMKYVRAFDNKLRKRNWSAVSRFDYYVKDVYRQKWENLLFPHTIISSIHPCGQLAEQIVQIYNNSKARYLFLMPCCNSRWGKPGSTHNIGGLEPTEEQRYEYWCVSLAQRCYGKVTISRDYSIKSPKNIIIKAEKP